LKVDLAINNPGIIQAPSRHPTAVKVAVSNIGTLATGCLPESALFVAVTVALAEIVGSRCRLVVP